MIKYNITKKYCCFIFFIFHFFNIKATTTITLTTTLTTAQVTKSLMLMTFFVVKVDGYDDNDSVGDRNNTSRLPMLLPQQ